MTSYQYNAVEGSPSEQCLMEHIKKRLKSEPHLNRILYSTTDRETYLRIADTINRLYIASDKHEVFVAVRLEDVQGLNHVMKVARTYPEIEPIVTTTLKLPRINHG